MTFKPLFGQFTYLSLSFVTFRVSRFHVSHLTHETFKLGLQNTLNMSKTTRVYFGVLQGRHVLISVSALLLVLRHFYYVAGHVLIGASALLLVLRHFCYVGRHVLISASALLLCATALQYCIVPSGTYCAVSDSFIITGLGIPIVI